MATESPLKVMRGSGLPVSMQDDFGDGIAKELGMLLREQNLRESNEREREINMCRSGSAPPSVQGSLAAIGGLFGNGGGPVGSMTEEEVRSHPAYLEYYYSHVNMNPRLPPPLLSREDWRFAQRLQGKGSVGDRRKLATFGVDGGGSHRSLFSAQPGILPTHKEEGEFLDGEKVGRSEWIEGHGDGLIGLASPGLDRRNLSNFLQEDLGMPSPIAERFSRPPSRVSHNGDIDHMTSAEALGHLRKTSLSFTDKETAILENMHNTSSSSLMRAHSLGTQASQTFASAVGASLSRNATPEPHLMKSTISAPSTAIKQGKFGLHNNDSSDLSVAFSSLKVTPNGSVSEDYSNSQEQVEHDMGETHNGVLRHQPIQRQNSQTMHSFKSSDSFNSPVLSEAQYQASFNDNNRLGEINTGSIGAKNNHRNYSRKTVANASNHYAAPSRTGAGLANGEPPVGQYMNLNASNSYTPSVGLSGYPGNPMLMNPMMANYAGISPGYDNIGSMDSSSIPNSLGGGLNGQIGASNLQMPIMDALTMAQLQRNAEFASQIPANLNDQSYVRNYGGSNYLEVLELQRAYLATLLAQQQSQYGMPYLGKNGNLNAGYLGSPNYGFTMPFNGSPMGSPVLSGSPIRHNDRSSRYTMGSKSAGGVWSTENGSEVEERYGSSLLDEFKNNKNRSFELSDITGHVCEFSADQIGSRFIQQKLETATLDEKNMIFKEIFPEALVLMTDVFGNYVLQKFFEHGTAKQRRELANLLTGHVLTLSLQMYGCRVIQKAVEVVDMDQKIKLVQELDGNVIRCVRDQNGNHVIQKCIECIPQDKIYFIISAFFGQVVALSTHPYGCRVIQRVLEHCKEENIQSMMMEEILLAVCTLAQDQYGNYVIQHVLEHGKEQERASVITKLAGQIVQMSQQKFASNVIEKCLEFGGPSEREILINEMLGTTDENEPLQAMMKDQFGNYVVQKVLETCDDQQREIILSRIKVHLNALKKYTYGKHIVTRVEKLVAAGERRNGIRASYNL